MPPLPERLLLPAPTIAGPGEKSGPAAGLATLAPEAVEAILFSEPLAPAGKAKPAWAHRALQPKKDSGPPAPSPTPAQADPAQFAPPKVVAIPAGPFIAGSDEVEREAAYALDEAAYGHKETRIRQWYSSELNRQTKETGAYFITESPISNRDYAYFIAATKTPAPDVGPRTWALYRVEQSYGETRRFAWANGRPPPGREDHPVVLVNWRDAVNYAAWLSKTTGEKWRLPTEEEWEKAARGPDGRRFPWGDEFDPQNLNSADAGPKDTVPIGGFRQGASPFGVLDTAGQVYEWTDTISRTAHRVVKGGAWDAKGCGACRPAARHERHYDMKHILLGFRLVREP